MKPPAVCVSISFVNRMSDNPLITFARNVHKLLYTVAGLTDIPVPAPMLLEAIETFATAKAAQANGGKAATAKKNLTRAVLTSLLKKLAIHVQGQCQGNLARLLSTGFAAVSLNRARYPLAKPSILRIVPGKEGHSLVTLSTESASRGCQIRVAEIGEDHALGEFSDPVFSTTSRNVDIPNLTPGKLYAFQGRNMGGSTTFSEWSDILQHRAA
ncbi:MAG: hypothetical protein V4640_14410 [Verrucomicrobiota bacterium]